MNTPKYILAFLFLLATTVFAQETPPADVIPGAAGGMEILGKRTLKSKTFYNPNTGEISVEINSGYLHYRDDNGRLREIDRRIRPNADSTAYEVARGLYKAEFALNLGGQDWAATFNTRDGLQFRTRLQSLGYYTSAGKKLQIIENAQSVAGEVDGDKIRYRNAFSGIDLEYTYAETRLKQWAFLSQTARDNLPAPPRNWRPDKTWLVLLSEIEFSDDLDAFAGDTLVSSRPPGRKKRIDHEGKGRLRFKDKSGKGRFSLPAGLAFHANRAAPDSTDDGSRSARVMFRRFYADNDKNVLITGVLLEWLNAQPAGTIVLDPTITLQPGPEDVDDTFLYAANGQNDNHGALTQIQIGPDRTTYERRGLLKFNLSGLPENAAVSSASLKLYLFAAGGTGNSFTLEAHKMLNNWVEGTGSTWNGGNNSGADWDYADRPDDDLWASSGMSSGSDYSSTILDTEEIEKSSVNQWEDWDVTNAVQDWADGTAANNGLALITESADISVYLSGQFYSSDYTTDVSLRPKLIITYKVDPLVTIHYDALSRPDTVTFASGVKEINTYDDNRGWLTKREYKRGSTNIYTFASTGTGDFDAVGNLKKVVYTHKSDAADSMEYSYDNHNRLTQFTYPNDTQKNRSYTYDDNGNFKTFDGTTFTYANDNNQLTNDGTRSFTFDAIGRAITVGSATLKYDIFNNMTEHGAGNKYTYDGANQRLRKTESGDSTYYFTAGLQVLAEYDENDDLQSEHIYGLGRMLAKFDPITGHKFFYSDHLGSTRLVSGSSESSADMRRDYYPYGEEFTTAGNDDTPFTFTGKELDSQTGLHYFGARYYDPTIGRWLTVDPLGAKHPSWSPYVHSLDKPVRLVDIDGRDVYDTRDPNQKPLNSDELTARTLNVAKQVLDSPNPGRFEMFLRTNRDETFDDVYQLNQSFDVEFGGTLKKNWLFGYSGIARFRLNTGFTLDESDKQQGMSTTASFSGLERNPALSQEEGTDIYHFRLRGVIRDPLGDEVATNSNFVLTITGTVEEINIELKKIGYQFQKDPNKDYYVLKKLDEEE